MEEHLKYIQQSLDLAEKNVKQGRGGPFGAIIVKNGIILAEGVNQVTSENDPTAHAEIVAIRNACIKLNSFSLEGASIYINAEPCPMCLSALYWAGVSKVFYAASSDDVEKIGFIDAYLYREMNKEPGNRDISMVQLMRDKSLKVLNLWVSKEDKIDY